jgi:hypothetical protein
VGLAVDVIMFSNHGATLSALFCVLIVKIDMSDSNIVHGDSPLQVAFDYARSNHLPLGAQVEVTDAAGMPLHFTVTRSNRSQQMEHGGEVHLVRTPPQQLIGGGEPDTELEREYTIHADSPEQAAMLFANESGVPPSTHLLVSQGERQQFFRTPSR